MSSMNRPLVYSCSRTSLGSWKAAKAPPAAWWAQGKATARLSLGIPDGLTIAVLGWVAGCGATLLISRQCEECIVCEEPRSLERHENNHNCILPYGIQLCQSRELPAALANNW